MLARKDREALAYNLRAFFPEEHVRKIIPKVFINFSYYLVDFFRYDKLDRKFIERNVTIHGREHIDDALKRGKGAILLTAHIGNYELGGAVSALLGYDMHVVALPHKDIRVNRMFNNQREKVGLKVIATGAMVKECFKVFTNNSVMGLLGDRSFGGKKIPVKMFGRTAALPRGFVFFVLSSDTALVPAFLVRQKNRYKYDLFFEPPIIAMGRLEAEIAADYAKVLERYVSMYPEQWYMFIKFWDVE